VAAPTIEDIYELSPLQSGLLFHTLYEPESRLYFEQILVPIESEIDRGDLERAWAAVIAAHPALRTSFHWQQIDKPVQVVHRTVEAPLDLLDLRNTRQSEQTAELARLCEADRQRGLDIGKAPLLRVTLIQLSSASYRMLLSFHHVILDGWSLQRVYRQFLETYLALRRGEKPQLPAGRPYRNYIRWLHAQKLAGAEGYWRSVLADYDSGARLLLHPRQETDEYASQRRPLPADETAALRQFAQRHRLTLNTLVQAAWAMLLSRLTGSDDVVFGTVVSGRPGDLAGVDEMVGLFINTVPVRVRLPRADNVIGWLLALQASQFAARQFDCTPLVQIQAWAGAGKDRALFDTIIAFENYPVHIGPVDNGPQATLVERTNYPLSVTVMPGDSIRMLYNRRLLSDATVQRLCEQYASILQMLTAADGVRIDELDLMSAPDRTALHVLNDTSADYPQLAIPELFDRHAATRPDSAALEFGGRVLSYRELARLSNQLAQRLVRIGVRRGDRVALMMEGSAGMVVSMLAILKAGAAYVPIDLACPQGRIETILADTQSKVTITVPALAARLAAIETAVLALDPDFSGLRDESEEAPSVPLGPEDVAYVMFTSGSTGRPKGAVIPHRAVVRLVCDNAFARIAATDKVGQGSNCAFDAATFEIWGALLNGATLVGLENDVMLQPAALARVIGERGVTVLFVTTALFNELVAAQPDTFHGLRVLLFGGERVNTRRVRQVLGSGGPEIFCHVYGPTETTTFATSHRLSSADLGSGTIPIGRPIDNTTAYVLDSAMRPVAPGETGELYLGGDGLAHGYLGSPGLTAQSFVPSPFAEGMRLYRTGDKVRWCEDGAIEFVGRLDDQIKLRGHRIEIGEIEFWLNRQPGLRQAIATVREDASGDKRIVAYVVPDPGAPADITSAVQDELLRRLPSYMQPHAIVALPALPLTHNGKIDRKALPDPAQSSERRFSAPRGELEQRLAALWRDVLAVEQIGRDENFFDVGGHSLRATQLVSRIGREFGVEIPLRAVFERATIAEQATLLEVGAPAAVPAPRIQRVARASQQ
jgi:amino acid adenylation domain-containing protein